MAQYASGTTGDDANNDNDDDNDDNVNYSIYCISRFETKTGHSH